VAYHDDPARLTAVSVDSSRITHADPRCTVGCAVLNRTIAGLLTDEPRPLQAALADIDEEVPPALHEALAGLPAGTDPAALRTSGYVVTTLQTALYDALSADTFEAAVVTAVNRRRRSPSGGWRCSRGARSWRRWPTRSWRRRPPGDESAWMDSCRPGVRWRWP
jgi:hypothetical protein